MESGRPADRPWVLAVHYYTPHPPWQPDPDRFRHHLDGPRLWRPSICSPWDLSEPNGCAAGGRPAMPEGGRDHAGALRLPRGDRGGGPASGRAIERQAASLIEHPVMRCFGCSRDQC